MFGMIEIRSDNRKFETCIKTISTSRVLCVKIPKLNKHNLRRAGKNLRGMRVVIPCECDRAEFEKNGICTVSSESFLCRIAFELYMFSLCEFKLQPMKATLLIRSTYFNEEDLKLLIKFCQNARYVSLCASNAEAAARYLFGSLGVAVMQDTQNADVIVNMYENSFSLHIIINGMEYVLEDVAFSLRCADVPSTHIKGICTVLLQEGRISTSDIIISSITYVKKNLDIQ